MHQTANDELYVNASDIQGEIERGEPVNYVGKIIVGDIDIGPLELFEVSSDRDPDIMVFLGFQRT